MAKDNPWAATEDEDPQSWSEEERMSRVTYFRVHNWWPYPRLSSRRKIRCRICRAQGKYYDIRETPIGDICFACWIDYPSCEICGVGARQPGIDGRPTYKGQYLCADCLVPDVSEAYIRWSFEHMLTLGSSYGFIMDGIPTLSVRLTRLAI